MEFRGGNSEHQVSKLSIVQLALNAGADVHQRGKGQVARKSLQAAAEVENIEPVKQLLKKGAKINAGPSMNYGRTVL
jgi:hypothetical protein